MPKFTIEIVETVTYTFTVEADTLATAIAYAEEEVDGNGAEIAECIDATTDVVRSEPRIINVAR